MKTSDRDFWDKREEVIRALGHDPERADRDGDSVVDQLLDLHARYLGQGATVLTAEERASEAVTVLGEVVPESIGVTLHALGTSQFIAMKGSHEAIYGWLSRLAFAMDWRVGQLSQARRLDLLRHTGTIREDD